MTYDYKFRNMALGEVAEICNGISADGYGVDEIYKEGHKMYVLFSKYVEGSEDSVEESVTDEIYGELDKMANRIRNLENGLSLIVPVPSPEVVVEDSE